MNREHRSDVLTKKRAIGHTLESQHHSQIANCGLRIEKLVIRNRQSEIRNWFLALFGTMSSLINPSS
mgnify:CR=1 FL=1